MAVAEPSPIALYFPRAGDEADAALARLIRGGSGQVRLAIYSLNRPVVVASILEARQRARLITDHVQSFGVGQLAALRELQAAGVPIKVNHHSGLMHLKLAVRGDLLAIGSFNWTNNAEDVNDEVLAVIASMDRATQAAWVFDCMWADQQRFVDWHPPTADERRAMLLQRPDLVQMPEF
jgi:phosphatidylserine/phosphatidylglycerophosphate/cardiolipin synthase-like enzyme